MNIPELLIASSLFFAALEDARTQKVHNYIWIPFSAGAIWMLFLQPSSILLLLLIGAVSLISVHFKLLGSADIFAFSAIALLGFSWSFLYAGLAFTFCLVGWGFFLILRKKIIFTERLPAIPITALAFLVAILI